MENEGTIENSGANTEGSDGGIPSEDTAIAPAKITRTRTSRRMASYSIDAKPFGYIDAKPLGYPLRCAAGGCAGDLVTRS